MALKSLKSQPFFVCGFLRNSRLYTLYRGACKNTHTSCSYPVFELHKHTCILYNAFLHLLSYLFKAFRALDVLWAVFSLVQCHKEYIAVFAVPAVGLVRTITAVYRVGAIYRCRDFKSHSCTRSSENFARTRTLFSFGTLTRTLVPDILKSTK